VPAFNKSQQEIPDLAQLMAKAIPENTDIGLAVASLFLVIEGVMLTASPEARARCYEVIQRRLAELMA
jgi:uncharacterized protein YjeT (DUF2065 family)